MKIITVIRPEDTVKVSILYDKNTDSYAFVNLTKGHICSCRFASEVKALADLERHRQQSKILSWSLNDLNDNNFKTEEDYNIIQIETEKEVKTLYGEEIGLSMYSQKVLPHLTSKKKNKVIFPSNIENVSISFVLGFKKLIKYDFDKFIIIEGQPEVVDAFKKIN